MAQQLGNLDVLDAARLGLVKGIGALSVQGYSESLSTSEQSICNVFGLTLEFPSAATTMKLASTSANDDVGGGGATVVLVEGLDANYAEIFELVTMDGTTPVTTNGTYLRINKLQVYPTSEGVNEGNIYIAASTDTFTAGVPTTPYNVITPLVGKSESGIYTLPADVKAIPKRINYTSGATSEVQAFLNVRLQGSTVWYRQFGIYAPDGSSDSKAIPSAAAVSGGTDVRLTASSSVSYGRFRVAIPVLLRYYSSDSRMITNVG